jgi:hypothetical protein
MTAPTLASPAAEIRRLRAELAEITARYTQLQSIVAAPDPHDDPEYWRSLFADGHRAELEAAYRRGREDTLRDSATCLDVDPPGPWPVPALGPLPAIDPELDRLRYPPNGRKQFGEPRPGDYVGGALPAEKPGMIWMPGPPAHNHECADVCHSYKPGWYEPDDAAAILAAIRRAVPSR